MKNWLLGTLQVVVGYFVISWITSFSFDFSYPVPTSVVISTPTVVNNITLADGTYYVWQTYEDVSTYENQDYSGSFKEKFRKEHQIRWLERGDKYKILEYKGRFLKIEIVETRSKPMILKVGDVFSSNFGWIKV